MKPLRAYLLLLAALLPGCSLIDEDLRDCGKKQDVTYELELLTNMSTELGAELGIPADASARLALQRYLTTIFTERAHDVDLSFYDVEADSVRLFRQQDIMDAEQTSYTLYIPARRYMHLALANVADNGVVRLEDDEYCARSRFTLSARDTVDSQRTGLFSARLPMDIQAGVDQQFEVSLYMVNCAVALVVDTLESGLKGLRACARGFSDGFAIRDSVYRYAANPVVRMDRLHLDEPGETCLAAVTFPSRPATKADESCWNIDVYATLPSGSVTWTQLDIQEPVGAGELKIIKVSALPDGSMEPRKSTVGASVALDWEQGSEQEVPL